MDNEALRRTVARLDTVITAGDPMEVLESVRGRIRQVVEAILKHGDSERARLLENSRYWRKADRIIDELQEIVDFLIMDGVDLLEELGIEYELDRQELL